MPKNKKSIRVRIDADGRPILDRSFELPHGGLLSTDLREAIAQAVATEAKTPGTSELLEEILSDGETETELVIIECIHGEIPVSLKGENTRPPEMRPDTFLAGLYNDVLAAGMEVKHEGYDTTETIARWIIGKPLNGEEGT